MAALRRVLVVLTVAWIGVAWAACDVAGARNTLQVEGIGTATFDDFTTDRASGSVSLRGDVCVQDLDATWTIRAERVDVTGLRNQPVEPRLFAEDASVSFGPWTLFAETAVATQLAVTVSTVAMSGPDVVGTAATVRYELDDGVALMRDLELQGTVFRARAAAGVLEGANLTLSDAVVTTCTCRGDAAYVVAAPVAEVDVVAGSFVVIDGEVRALGVTLPLADRVALTGDLADDLSFPLVVERQSVSSGGLGHGWTVLLPDVAPGDALEASVGITGLTERVRPVARLEATAPTAAITFALPADGLVLDAHVRRDLGRGFGVTMAFHNRATPRDDYLHQGVFGLEHAWRSAFREPFGSLAVDTRAFAAVSAQTLEGAPVAGARIGVGADVGWTSPATPVGTFGLDLGTIATAYPNQAAHQLVGTVTPSWSASAGPLSGSLRYRGRAVEGRSPFGTTLDRATPQSELDAAALLTWSDRAVEASVSFAGRYDFLPSDRAVPGWTDLDAAASLAVPVAGGTWSASLASDVAGLVGDRATTGPFVQARTGYAWSGHELGVRARYALDASTLDDLEISGRVRIEAEDVIVTPYLAVDVAPWLHARAPHISGHGLELEWTSCCGTLTVGYEQGSNGLTTTFSFRVDPRPLVPPETAP